jgi:hypothetical protein
VAVLADTCWRALCHLVLRNAAVDAQVYAGCSGASTAQSESRGGGAGPRGTVCAERPFCGPPVQARGRNRRSIPPSWTDANASRPSPRLVRLDAAADWKLSVRAAASEHRGAEFREACPCCGEQVREDAEHLLLTCGA